MVEHNIVPIENMREALGKDSILEDLQDRVDLIEGDGWELKDTIESKGTTAALIFVRDNQ